MEKLRVCELFAGVGGFRLGLECTKKYKVVWSNQWEPSTKAQHASKIYEARFGKKGHSNENIEKVPTSAIPDHDILVGGFPCQDYSVASTLKNSKGLLGKKGVLWWSIHRILEEKKNKPQYLFLENVDRLLKSPASQRGRDFAVMLKSLDQLGYAVTWRVINAADYGMPQRRRRVFFLGYHKSSPLFKELEKTTAKEWLMATGAMAMAFPVTKDPTLQLHKFKLNGDLVKLSSSFNQTGSKSPFANTGVCCKGEVSTLKTTAHFKGETTVLGDILEKYEANHLIYVGKSVTDKLAMYL